MKILIAPNAFKGSLSSVEVCERLRQGILSVAAKSQIDSVPLADGGDGTLEVMLNHWGGHRQRITVEDPLGRIIQAEIGIDPDGKRAIIEMARASGLALLEESEKAPLKTTSFGTGQLIQAAIESGVSEIYLGIGGSATNEGGAGMGAALGFEHLDSRGNPLVPCGDNLNQISEIRRPQERTIPNDLRVTVLCDVTNPLCGENGASAIYGPQKGATPEMVQELDASLHNLASLWERDLGKQVANIPGSGAAGGMGGGAMVYLNAELVSGTDVLFQMTDLEEKVRSADIILTGEGALDRTSLQGKIPGRVAELAKKHAKPCYGICGVCLETDRTLFSNSGFTEVMEIAPPETPIDDRIQNASEWVFKTGAEIGRIARK